MTTNEFMKEFDIKSGDMDKLRESIKDYLEDFKKKTPVDMEKEFVRLISADVAMRKIFDLFHANKDEILGAMKEGKLSKMFQDLTSIVATFTLLGANFGWMRSVDDDETATN